MIAFGCAIASEPKYRRYARPGIVAAADPAAPVLTVRGESCLFRAYNRILRAARRIEGLEALVLLHEDVEIVDPHFARKLRRAMREPEIGIVGPIGAVALDGMDWFRSLPVGTVQWHALEPEQAFGIAHAEERVELGAPATREVDAIDGLMLCLSPRAVAELSFDESLGPGLHGYDADICLEARLAGLRVMTTPLRCVHYTRFNFDRAYQQRWAAGYARFRAKWDGRAHPEPAPV